MRLLMIPMAAIAMVASFPVAAQGRENDRRDQQSISRGEVERSRQRVQNERGDVRDAQRFGTKRDVRMEQRDVDRARQEYRDDARDWRNSGKRAYQERREDARDWQRGQRYAWNRPDPRYNGYYANNYYRSGSYRPYQLRANDRIYRGNDNRYYCRRGDGSTGLIIGAIGGGVLGNAIAPGGSKTLGTILGGSLGAILGNSIGNNNVTCR
jgi:hypothetical protein